MKFWWNTYKEAKSKCNPKTLYWTLTFQQCNLSDQAAVQDKTFEEKKSIRTLNKKNTLENDIKTSIIASVENTKTK